MAVPAPSVQNQVLHIVAREIPALPEPVRPAPIALAAPLVVQLVRLIIIVRPLPIKLLVRAVKFPRLVRHQLMIAFPRNV